jgi:hypothetical protein
MVAAFSHWRTSARSNMELASSGNQGPPPLALEKANSRPAADPENVLSLELVALVSSGRMDPEDAIEAQSEADGDDDSWGDTDDASTDDDELYFDDEEELADLPVGSLTKFLAPRALSSPLNLRSVAILREFRYLVWLAYTGITVSPLCCGTNPSQLR